jgi:predicted dehydrogenase
MKPTPTSVPDPVAAPTATEGTETATPAGNRTIGYALVGLGHISQVAVMPGFAHARNSRLVALVSGDRKKLQKLGKEHGISDLYSYEEFDDCLANPAVDAVYIGLPNDQHYEYVLRAARAGKHILCEKPLALTATEARLMIQAARDNDVKLMTAYRLHFEPANLATIELVRSGMIGEVRYFNSSFSYVLEDDDNIRLQFAHGGGPMYDIGVYCINAARYLMRDEPLEVSGMLARSDDPRFHEVEETAGAVLRFPRGRLASFVVSFGAAEAARYEIVGTKGRIVMEPAYEYSEGLKQIVTIDGKTHEKEFARTDQFGGEIEAFSECIIHDREPEPSGEEGLADVRIVEAIFASDAKGRTIRLPALTKATRPTAAQLKRKRAVKKPKTVNVDSPHD